MDLTETMKFVLIQARRNKDYIVAGYNTIRGCAFEVNWKTLDALISRGLAEHRLSCEGGFAATLTFAGVRVAEDLISKDEAA